MIYLDSFRFPDDDWEWKQRLKVKRTCYNTMYPFGILSGIGLERLDFAPRDYGSFALPGGRSTALRVELGEGKGHNWFCVLYPALCVSGAQAKYPSQAENALVFGRYEVRFAVVDTVKNWIQQ